MRDAHGSDSAEAEYALSTAGAALDLFLTEAGLDARDASCRAGRPSGSRHGSRAVRDGWCVAAPR